MITYLKLAPGEFTLYKNIGLFLERRVPRKDLLSDINQHRSGVSTELRVNKG